MSDIRVMKTNGELQPFDYARIQEHTERACRGLENCSPSLIELNAMIEVYDGVKSSQLQHYLINAATDLINEVNNPEGHVDYQFAAGFLYNELLRMDVYGQYEVPRLYTIVKKNVERGFYTEELLNWYSESDWDRIEALIDHRNDEKLSLSAIKQFRTKYLVQDRTTREVYETPQVAYAVMAATTYSRTKDMVKIKDYIDDAVGRKSTRPTPIIAGVRTPTKQFSSCVVIEAGDTMDSIFAAGEAQSKYAAKRAGIGFHIGRLRGRNAPIRGGEVSHTGVLAFVKKWFSDLRCASQGGIRNASACYFFPIWHWDFEELVVLKNNQGTEETRVRGADYSVILNGYFLQRALEGKPLVMFHPGLMKDLDNAFYENTPLFIELYEKYEADPTIQKKQIDCLSAIHSMVLKERRDTGRINLLFIDNVQNHSPYRPEKGDVVRLSNLCSEILLTTEQFNKFLAGISREELLAKPELFEQEKGRIALCTLGSINWGTHATPQELRRSCRVQVSSLNELLMYQDYVSLHAQMHSEEYAPLGIGITSLAQWAAQRGFKYGSPEMLAEVKVWIEHQLYYCLEASVDAAKELGECRKFRNTWYAEGVFPWERITDSVRELTDFTPSADLDWETLRADIILYGMRNTVVLACPPVESSSATLMATNGISHPKDLISVKSSKGQTTVFVVPQYHELKDKYQLLWDSDCNEYMKVVAVLGVYVDQTISADTWYDPSKHLDSPDGKIPAELVLGNLIRAYNWGVPTQYYDLTDKNAVRRALKAKSQLDNDPEEDIIEEEDEDCEACKV